MKYKKKQNYYFELYLHEKKDNSDMYFQMYKEIFTFWKGWECLHQYHLQPGFVSKRVIV